MSDNQAIGGQGGNPGQGYAPEIFLFREAKVIFHNQHPLTAPYSIMADQMAPAGHLDAGVVKQGPGQLTLSNTSNNYRGGTSIEGGTLSVTDPKVLGSQTAPLTLNGGNLRPTKTMTLSQPIVASGNGGIDTPQGTTLTTTGNISGNGTLHKTNNGTWKQTGTSTHSGQLNIQQGILQVNGGAQLDGTLNVHLEPGIYPRNKEYHLIEGGVLLGNFQRFTSNANGAITTENDFTDYQLTLVDPELILPLPNNQLPGNQKQIANYLFCPITQHTLTATPPLLQKLSLKTQIPPRLYTKQWWNSDHL